MPQSLASLHVHFVFSTLERQAWLEPPVHRELCHYIGGVVKEAKCVLIRANGMPDHMHLLVSLGREACAADVMRLVKTNSSKWLHDVAKCSPQFAWQKGYGAFAVSFSGLQRVIDYIDHQQEWLHSNQIIHTFSIQTSFYK